MTTNYSAIWWLILFHVVSSSNYDFVTIPIPAVKNLQSIEINALKDIYDSTQGIYWNWRDSNVSGSEWNFGGSPNPCTQEWQGIKCDCSPATKRYCNVQSLVLDELNLNGYLPSSIGSFQLMTQLIIRYNSDLRGSIPDSIGNLSSLHELTLQYNALTGSIPQTIGNLSMLELFQLDYNQLIGTIPDEIYQLHNLTIISLYNNKLSGTISPLIGNTTALYSFIVSNNLLTSSIPNDIINCTKLVKFRVDFNYLTGTLPIGVFQKDLYNLRTSNNYLTGPIPDAVGNSKKLGNFFMNDNFFSQTLPHGLSNCTRIQYMRVNSNLLTGPLPAYAVNWTVLQEIEFTENYFTGTLPIFPNNTVHLFASDWKLSVNYITGIISESFCNIRFGELILNQNFLTNSLPTCLSKQAQLSDFYINDNLISGTLPRGFDHLLTLTTFYADTNILSGRLFDISHLPGLQTLYVQNNRMTGPVQLFLNTTYLQSLSFVDISNNEFTGQLPDKLFQEKLPLQSFAAASNCFTGTIPESICSLPKLIFLDLDGLATAKVCRRSIFKNIPYISDSFVLKNKITQGIPLCLFNMTYLQTLHLSGNEIKWSLPSHFDIGPSLNQMSLSHNAISGTIPDVIFSRYWESLDLSFNKITGVISPSITVNNVNTSLTLQVNRLSGHIPSNIQHMENINILNGNLFKCDFHRNTLPVYDSKHNIYQCGSNSFNQSIIIWSVFCGLIVLFILILFIQLKLSVTIQFECIRMLKEFVELLVSYRNSLLNEKYQLTDFTHMLTQFRKLMLYLTLIICVIGLPIYTVLTEYYKTLSFEYAWIVSAAYLSGETAAIVLLIFYVLWLILLFAIWRSYQQHNNSSVSYVESIPWGRRLQFLCIRSMNNLVMILVNIGYVLVIINNEAHIIFIAQISMALFKLLWNDFIVRGMILLSRRLHSSDNEDSVQNVTQEMPTMTFIVLFNTIIAPCLATTAVDPSCLVNVFIQPSPVTSIFPNFKCTVESVQTGECVPNSGESFTTISYDPPFIYSYQCTSAILSNYAAVYIYMFVAVAFLKPLLVLIMAKYYSQIPPQSVLYISIENTIYELLKPVDHINVRSETRALFQKERFALRLISKIAVFLTFGVVFPPIAVVLCVACYCETYLNEIILGRFLCNIKDSEKFTYFANKLHRDCQNIAQLLITPTVTLVVPFAAIFYAFFIFDIYGDQVGWKLCIWASILLGCTPPMLWCSYYAYESVLHSNKNDKIEEVHTAVHEVTEFEMRTTSTDVYPKCVNMDEVHNVLYTADK